MLAAKHIEFGSTTITDNGQFNPLSAGVVFWNQGNTEVVIDGNFRLAPAVLNPVTGLYSGGESFVIQDPTGRILSHSFSFAFNDTVPAGQTAFNKLTIQYTYHID